MAEENKRSGSSLRGLIVLNVVLLTLLAAVTFGARADAQMRQRGDYNMVAGGASGTNSGVVYVVDTVNHQMIAVTFDQTSKTIVGVGARNLARDAAQVSSGGRRN